MDQKPTVRCEAHGVDPYAYPFCTKPGDRTETAMFVEHHTYCFTTEEVQELRPYLTDMVDDKDLQRLGYKKHENGISSLSPRGESCIQGGKS